MSLLSSLRVDIWKGHIHVYLHANIYMSSFSVVSGQSLFQGGRSSRESLSVLQGEEREVKSCRLLSIHQDFIETEMRYVDANRPARRRRI